MTSRQALDVLYALEMQDEKEDMNNLPDHERLNIVDPDVGKWLYIQAMGTKAKNIVEIGAGGGYSTVWLGLAAQINGGKVMTYEIDPARAEMAKANIEKAGLGAHVEVIAEDARQALRGETTPLDLVFIDADKAQYETYFDVVYKRLNLGSLLIADRVLYYESELEDYVSYMQNHPNLDSVTVPMANGLEMTVKID